MNSMNSAPPPPLPGYQPASQPSPINTQYRSPDPPAFEKPQYAQFDAPSKPINEDALPHMPSWGDATSKKVEETAVPEEPGDVELIMPSWGDATSKKVEETAVPEEPGDVELNRLDHNGSATSPMLAGATGASLRSPARSPAHQTCDEYGFPTQDQQNNGFVGGAPQRRVRSPDSFHSGQQVGVVDQYGQRRQGYDPALPVREGTGMYGQNQEYGRSSHRLGVTNYNGQQGRAPRPYGSPSPGPPMGNHARGQGTQGYGQPSAALYQDLHQDNSYSADPYARSISPGYAPSGSTRFEPSHNGYQNNYQDSQELDSGHRQDQQYAGGVGRKPVNGSWKDV
ncbi:uncharacterized protein K441DRAFT_734097 [Cenococcum geophilum 1.58]|uniref:uncharacterized protein n=1 Tax=Cenococcum geophilum 1.58 TaxID=794803 RepID=UPI00358E7B87|nr:hypothetical protein K441DRAFT_734097 [Cenococcum geophilum 1.58]